jgi:hypothetical protein
MKRIMYVLLICASMLAVNTSTFAQQLESRITGKLTDSSSLSLPGVTVTLTSTQTGQIRTVATSDTGTYTITNLAPGVYQLRMELDGFAPSTQTVVLGIGQTETRNAILNIAALTEIVQVNATAQVLDTSSARSGVTMATSEIQALPVNGRNFANLMTLAPGAASDGNGGWASVRFNGKSNQQNYMSFDGIDGTFVWDANPGYLSATGSQFRLQTSLESVAEFRVNSGLAPAESGLGAGGNITVISKSGSNRFAGSVFSYLRNDALDAATPYDNIKQPLTMYQSGGSLGGPIARNRAFFFGSYEDLHQRTNLTFTEAVPSDAARQRIITGDARAQAVAPLLNGFPRGTTPTLNPLLSLATVTNVARQRERAVSLRYDQTFTNNQTAYIRYLMSDGQLDTPDRTVTPRRVRATERPQNFVGSYQIIHGSLVNELKYGYNAPSTSARAYGTQGYDAIGVSLSGSATSASIDARGTTGIARSGLLIRASSASSTTGSSFQPHSTSLQDALTWSHGGHTIKVGGEYRRIEAAFQYLGSTELTFNSIDDFIANKPNAIAVSYDSPLFKPQQFYAIGFAQDTWHASDRLTFELGARYDFYSVVHEKYGRAKPFFVEDNAFASDVNNFYNPDYNNLAPRLSAVYRINEKTVVRGGYGWFYGPGQLEDRIQPIENYIERRRVTAAELPTLTYPIAENDYRNVLSIRGYTHDRPDEYSIQYGASFSRELPSAINLTVAYTGSQGRDMFLRGVANVLDTTTRTRPIPAYGQIDYKTSGCVDGLQINGQNISGCGRASYDAAQVNVSRRFRSGLTGMFQYQYSRSRGTTQGSNEASTAQNTFDYSTEYGINPQDLPHTMNGTITYTSHGWNVTGMFNARSGVPINVTINRPDNVSINGVTVTNIPGGNSRGTQRPDLVPGVNPYLKDGVRWLNPAAFATPQPGTFGNLPRNFLRGPSFWQTDLSVNRNIGRVQMRVDVFNILNHLNYESPAANLPNGAPGVPFTSSQTGTFGYIMGPLNRTVGLGTARQTQVSIRYSF